MQQRVISMIMCEPWLIGRLVDHRSRDCVAVQALTGMSRPCRRNNVWYDARWNYFETSNIYIHACVLNSAQLGIIALAIDHSMRGYSLWMKLIISSKNATQKGTVPSVIDVSRA